jgi:hypothetical protein
MDYERNVDLAAQAIAKKARELLEALPGGRDASCRITISPGNWWMI